MKRDDTVTITGIYIEVARQMVKFDIVPVVLTAADQLDISISVEDIQKKIDGQVRRAFR